MYILSFVLLLFALFKIIICLYYVNKSMDEILKDKSLTEAITDDISVRFINYTIVAITTESFMELFCCLYILFH